MNAQEIKRGNIWTIGFTPVSVFDFNSGTVSIADTFQFPAIQSNSCISDTNGKLLFFTSGFAIVDSQGFLMDNGLNVNCPFGDHILADYYGHYSLFTQTSIILPKKGNTYYVFSTGMSDSSATLYLNQIDAKFDVLNYSIVDMDSNAGKGKVTVKNKILMDHQEYANCALTAVKHGNGKDWWLIKADCYHNRFQLFIVQEDSILGPYYQYSTDTSVYCHTLGQIYFSPDGSKFAASVYGGRFYDTSIVSYLPDSTKQTTSDGITYIPNRVDIYDFDRCNGVITYKNFYVTPYDTSSFPFWNVKDGICFSPNGKLLYMSNMYSIYQIDVEDTNKSNALFIAGPDTTIAQFPWYNEMACGPDGKLYIGTFSGSNYMSYIAQPDIIGLGCNFTPHGIWQPYTGLQDPPNMPNYGLGAAPVGGNCWPANIEEIKDELSIIFYPNPTNRTLHLLSDKVLSNASLSIIGLTGETVLKRDNLFGKRFEFDIHSIANGIYLVQINFGDSIKRMKLVKE